MTGSPSTTAAAGVRAPRGGPGRHARWRSTRWRCSTSWGSRTRPCRGGVAQWHDRAGDRARVPGAGGVAECSGRDGRTSPTGPAAAQRAAVHLRGRVAVAASDERSRAANSRLDLQGRGGGLLSAGPARRRGMGHCRRDARGTDKWARLRNAAPRLRPSLELVPAVDAGSRAPRHRGPPHPVRRRPGARPPDPQRRVRGLRRHWPRDLPRATRGRRAPPGVLAECDARTT